VVPDKRRRDLQNFSDTICDALNGVLYEDDSQITTLLMRKVWGKEWELLISVGQN
jgi:Holliday junction resolvase RusA-like endonuclease